jgi:NitT/TauT family transport system substrate-binding protein
MRPNLWRVVSTFVGLWSLAGLTACGVRSQQAPALRIAVLPILDALPLYVAQQEGYFEAEGIPVDLIPAGSAAERDQLLQAGQVDGMINDLVALALANREGTNLVAVRYAMVATPEFRQFGILASGTSTLMVPGDLRHVPVGISEGTVIEYVTDRLLLAEGLLPSEIKTLGTGYSSETNGEKILSSCLL